MVYGHTFYIITWQTPMRRHLYPPPPTLWFEQWEPQSVPNVFQSEVKVDIYQSKGLNNTTEGLDICCNISQMKYPPELIRNLKFANIWYCLPFASTWVHPWFFVWVRIAHLFNFLCFWFVCLRIGNYFVNSCITLWLLSLIQIMFLLFVNNIIKKSCDEEYMVKKPAK